MGIYVGQCSRGTAFYLYTVKSLVNAQVRQISPSQNLITSATSSHFSQKILRSSGGRPFLGGRGKRSQHIGVMLGKPCQAWDRIQDFCIQRKFSSPLSQLPVLMVLNVTGPDT